MVGKIVSIASAFTIASVFFASSVHAFDLDGKPAANDWSGGYLGVNLGAAFLDDDISVSSAVALTAIAPDAKDASFTGGGQVGWNLQLDDVLLGVEGDMNFVDLNSSVAFTSPLASGNSARAEFDWFATIRARAGITVEGALFYATGGVAFTEMDVRSRVASAGNFNLASGSEFLTGWTIGGGVEYMFDPDWTAKIEYLYADFGSKSFNGSSAAPATTFRARPEFHIVRVGANYQF